MAPKGLMAPPDDGEEQMGDAPEGMMDEEAGETDLEEASPEEQKQFDSLLNPIYDMIHGDGAEAIMQKLKAGAQDLGNTIGEMAAQMLISIEETVMNGGGNVMPAVKLQVILEIIEELVSIANAAGLVGDDEMEQESLTKQAATAAIGMYGANAGASGKIDKNQVAAELQKMSQMGGVGGGIAGATMKMIGGAQQAGGV